MKIHNTISRIIIIAIVCLLCDESMAQSYLSPYSRFGLGDLQTGLTPRNRAMGGVSTGLVNTRNVSAMNPASYMNLDSMSILFNLGFEIQLAKLSYSQGNEILRSSSNKAGLTSLNFNFPITSWLKSGIGLQPLAMIDYDVYRVVEGGTNVGKYTLNNVGYGGMNKAYIGLATGFGFFSLGANVNLVFGNNTKGTVMATYDTLYTLATSTTEATYTRLLGLSFDFGIQLKQTFGKYLVGIGASYTPAYNINAVSSYTVLSTGTNFADTIVNYNDKKGEIHIPEAWTAGFSLEESGKWLIAGEYRKYNFKDYSEYGVVDENLTDAWSAHFGTELIGNLGSKSYLSRMSYRAGATLGKNYVAYAGNIRNMWSISVGLGMPIRNSLSRIDVTFEFGRYGDRSKGQIQEDFATFSVAIFGFDRWFFRRKYN